MKLKPPKWLYWEREGYGLRTRAWGSRKTVLHVLCLDSMRGGPTVWMVAARGWCLTFGPEDAVEEGQISGQEADPRTRHRTWRRPNGRSYLLTYTPRGQERDRG